jgi:hypothetical protein
LNFDRLVSVDVVEDFFKSLRARMEVFEDFVGFFDFRTILSDTVDAVQILGWVVHCVAGVFVIFAGTDDLPDEWIFEDSGTECLVVDCLENGVLVRSGQLQHFQYVKPHVFDLSRV